MQRGAFIAGSSPVEPDVGLCYSSLRFKLRIDLEGRQMGKESDRTMNKKKNGQNQKYPEENAYSQPREKAGVPGTREIQKKLLILQEDLICECKTAKDADGSFLFHCHDGCEIFVLLEGEVDFYTENDGKRLKRGDVVCIPPYGFHRGEVLSPGLYDRIVINIRDDLLKSLSTARTDLSACFYLSSQKLNYLHLTQEELSRFASLSASLQDALSFRHYGDDVLADILLRQILLLLNCLAPSQRLPEYSGIMPRLVADAFSYVEEHLTEELSLPAIAEYLHHNGTYISRCFRQVMGVSIQQYIIAKRIALAQQLLRQGYSPQDVCYMAGFRNYSHFSRTFSQDVGLSPKQYQKRLYQS